MTSTPRSPGDEREARQLDAQLLADLWIFRAAARAGSLSGAAQQLNVTPGAVSQRVLRLEARLQTALFERGKGRLTLTEAGNLMLESMNDVSLVLNKALTRAQTSRRASIVVSCAPSLATEWLIPHLEDFYRECPDVELQVRAETVLPSAAWMAAQEVDVHIYYMHVRANDVVELAAVRELTFPVCSREYRSHLNALPRERREVLVMHDEDCWREGEGPGAEWDEWLENAGSRWAFTIKGKRNFNQAYLAYQAAVYGQGVAMGRAVSVSGLLRAGKLVRAFDVPPVPSAHHRIVARAEPVADSPVARFCRWLERALTRTQQETLTLIGEHSWTSGAPSGRNSTDRE
jgi:DNA-binding transcriptional LysR family regulator